MTVVTWRLQLKVTHLFHRHAKMVQMSSGTFCTALHCLCSSEKKRKTLVYVCIMCNLRCASLYMALHEANYVHVGYIMCCLPLCRLMAVLHESTHLMFLICQCHDEFFSAFGFMHTNAYRTSVLLSVQHTWYVHTLTLFFFNKYKGDQKQQQHLFSRRRR